MLNYDGKTWPTDQMVPLGETTENSILKFVAEAGKGIVFRIRDQIFSSDDLHKAREVTLIFMATYHNPLTILADIGIV